METAVSSLRQHCNLRYAEVVREERHFCAVLFHALMRCEDNLKKFLLQCGVKDADTRDLSDAAVYVEYAYARDLWDSLNNCTRPDDTRLSRAEVNRIKRDLIQAHFTPPVPLPDDKLDDPAAIMAFNKNFISGPASNQHIQSPACWTVGHMYACFNAAGLIGEHFRNALHLKWAMRVKPDIVIELNANEVVSIEAKMESGEALYPSGADRRFLIGEVGEDAIRNYYERTQLDIQDMLMRNILGFKQVHCVFLTRDGSKPHAVGAVEMMAVELVSWQKALEGLELGEAARPSLQRVWQRMAGLKPKLQAST